jgi:aminoglycoside phosphotransferase (APT) family kinase protein
VALIAGGKSNLTYRVASDAGEVVLRRPPLGHVLPTAHDMAREYRVQTALASTDVPVPRTLWFEPADGVLEAPFYVMERVVGHVCRNALPDGYADRAEEREQIALALVDTLARLHTVEPAEIGLQDFGRPAGFMARQLRRWTEQWEHSKTHEVAPVEALRTALTEAQPGQHHTAIVHGDYRLDNTVLHPTRAGQILAVLDWEMSTLGDPLADLGTLLAYWSQPGDPDVLVAARMMPPVTASRGFLSREQVVARYSDQTGFDVSDVSWYQAFSYFKLAVICQGIAARAAGGAMLGSGFETAARVVDPLARAGLHFLGVSGPTDRRRRSARGR